MKALEPRYRELLDTYRGRLHRDARQQARLRRPTVSIALSPPRSQDRPTRTAADRNTGDGEVWDLRGAYNAADVSNNSRMEQAAILASLSIASPSSRADRQSDEHRGRDYSRGDYDDVCGAPPFRPPPTLDENVYADRVEQGRGQRQGQGRQEQGQGQGQSGGYDEYDDKYGGYEDYDDSKTRGIDELPRGDNSSWDNGSYEQHANHGQDDSNYGNQPRGRRGEPKEHPPSQRSPPQPPQRPPPPAPSPPLRTTANDPHGMLVGQRKHNPGRNPGAVGSAPRGAPGAAPSRTGGSGGKLPPAPPSVFRKLKSIIYSDMTVTEERKAKQLRKLLRSKGYSNAGVEVPPPPVAASGVAQGNTVRAHAMYGEPTYSDTAYSEREHYEAAPEYVTSSTRGGDTLLYKAPSRGKSERGGGRGDDRGDGRDDGRGDSSENERGDGRGDGRGNVRGGGRGDDSGGGRGDGRGDGRGGGSVSDRGDDRYDSGRYDGNYERRNDRGEAVRIYERGDEQRDGEGYSSRDGGGGSPYSASPYTAASGSERDSREMVLRDASSSYRHDGSPPSAALPYKPPTVDRHARAKAARLKKIAEEQASRDRSARRSSSGGGGGSGVSGGSGGGAGALQMGDGSLESEIAELEEAVRRAPSQASRYGLEKRLKTKRSVLVRQQRQTEQKQRESSREADYQRREQQRRTEETARVARANEEQARIDADTREAQAEERRRAQVDLTWDAL